MKRTRKWTWVAAIVVAALGLALFIVSRKMCLRAWWDYRLVLPHCPEGKLRQVVTVSAEGLRRGADGTVVITAVARYTTHGVEDAESAVIPSFTATLALVDAAGRETALPALASGDGWQPSGEGRRAVVTLPEVPDGDYKLRAKVTSRVGEDTVDVDLPLYTPAQVHVITDRPLYQPGNLVRFRAVVLRARDLAPLDGRPGLWMVTDPSGEVLLEEKSPAGEWGVVAGSFPLDKGAPTGIWHVKWISAGASDEVGITVEPFTLPRFRVEASAAKSFYRAGESPEVGGAVIYSSGAPVANAKIEVTWSVSGDWPPPADWLTAKPATLTTTGPNGRFKLALPQIPSDLDRAVTLYGRIAAIDPAGDRVEGSAAVLLSRDANAAEPVTELEGGLVPEFNNRLYLRVATADGRILPGAKINVKRAWEADDQGIDAVLDEDGVASLQIDPGAPVNVVIPPRPYRPTPRPLAVRREQATDLVSGQQASIDDQTAMDGWTADLAPCAKWVDGAVSGSEVTAMLALRVDAGGKILAASAGPSPLEACALAAVRAKQLPAAPAERVLSLELVFSDPMNGKIAPDIEAVLAPPAGFAEAVTHAAFEARGCVTNPPMVTPMPRALFFQAHAGAKEVTLSWIPDARGGASPVIACLEPQLTRLVLDKPAEHDGFGLVRFTLQPQLRPGEERPQATVMQGYELLVTAHVDGEPTTRLIMTPGSVPNLRLRATPVLAKVGDTVTVAVIRGPDYSGDLPVELTLDHLKGHLTAKLDPDSHQATFTLPPEMSGWGEIRGGGARALIYVQPKNDLVVAIAPRQPTYAPGATAELDLSTKIDGREAKAAVGLFGVDASLGQLAILPGADDLGRLRPKVGTSTPAFGVLDGQALTLGRVRGANAAAATVVRVTTIPPPPALDAVVNASCGDPLRRGRRADRSVLRRARRAAHPDAGVGSRGAGGREDAPGDHGQVVAAGAGGVRRARRARRRRVWPSIAAVAAARGSPGVDRSARRRRGGHAVARGCRELACLGGQGAAMKRTGIASLLLIAALSPSFGCGSKRGSDEDDRGENQKEGEKRWGPGDSIALRDYDKNVPVIAAAPAPAPAPPPKTPAPGAVAFAAHRGDDHMNTFESDEPKKPEPEGKPAGERPAAPSRAWFPETFLFEPLVVTDENGKATVSVRVPDRLTTWRVLALAHSRSGAQGGATTSFLGTLPTYVDAVSPPFLLVGDEVHLPIQAVNTTTTPVAAALHLEAVGATVQGGIGPLTIPAEGSVVTGTVLKVDHPGTVKLRASLGEADAVVKTFDVLPTGKPETRNVSGTLAAPRVLTIEGPAGSDPASDRVRLQVFPGALALLRTELGAAMDRNGVAEDAYALLLAGRAPALLIALGADADPAVLRSMEILLTQRVVRWARTLDVDTATLLTEAALAHPGSPLLARLGERIAAWLAANQRPDGTFGGANGWTLQRVLVTTADGLRALHAADGTPLGKQRALAASLRASGAFERNLARVDDGYTAAAILAAGDVQSDAAARLRKIVLTDLAARADGSKVLRVRKGVVRADGSPPSEAEATALAVLALIGAPGVPDAPLADLGGALLGSYSPSSGWGDGRADLVCMQAVLLLFKDPIPPGVKITLTMDGQPIADGQLDAKKLHEVLALSAPSPGSAGAHQWGITADPAVAGLGFSLTLQSWVPWSKEAPHGGLELLLPPSVDAISGHPAEVTVRAAAPAGVPLTITVALPAGVQVDTGNLDALVADGTLARYTSADGSLELDTPGVQAGQTFAAKLKLIPTLAGTLHSAASTLRVGDQEFHAPPMVWNIK